MNKSCVLLALGANLHSDVGSILRTPAETIRASLSDLAAHGLVLRAQSRLYATPCFPAGAGPDYVNAAVVLDAAPGQTAPDVLAILHTLEAKYGRQRAQRWAGRVLDIDLLAYGDQVLPDAATHRFWRDLAPADQARLTPEQLILPHPRLADRAFVLVPLAEVAPDWCHPVLGQTVQQMRDALDPADLAAVRPLP